MAEKPSMNKEEAPPPPLEQAHACPLLFRQTPRPVYKESEEGGVLVYVSSSLSCRRVWQPASLAAIFLRHAPRVLIGR